MSASVFRRCLRVDNIPLNVTEDQLCEYFQGISSCIVFNGPKQSLGFGFVFFKTESKALLADIKLQHIMYGHVLKVNLSRFDMIITSLPRNASSEWLLEKIAHKFQGVNSVVVQQPSQQWGIVTFDTPELLEVAIREFPSKKWDNYIVCWPKLPVLNEEQQKEEKEPQLPPPVTHQEQEQEEEEEEEEKEEEEEEKKHEERTIIQDDLFFTKIAGLQNYIVEHPEKLLETLSINYELIGDGEKTKNQQQDNERDPKLLNLLKSQDFIEIKFPQGLKQQSDIQMFTPKPPNINNSRLVFVEFCTGEENAVYVFSILVAQCSFDELLQRVANIGAYKTAAVVGNTIRAVWRRLIYYGVEWSAIPSPWKEQITEDMLKSRTIAKWCGYVDRIYHNDSGIKKLKKLLRSDDVNWSNILQRTKRIKLKTHQKEPQLPPPVTHQKEKEKEPQLPPPVIHQKEKEKEPQLPPPVTHQEQEHQLHPQSFIENRLQQIICSLGNRYRSHYFYVTPNTTNYENIAINGINKSFMLIFQHTWRSEVRCRLDIYIPKQHDNEAEKMIVPAGWKPFELFTTKKEHGLRTYKLSVTVNDLPQLLIDLNVILKLCDKFFTNN